MKNSYDTHVNIKRTDEWKNAKEIQIKRTQREENKKKWIVASEKKEEKKHRRVTNRNSMDFMVLSANSPYIAHKCVEIRNFNKSTTEL